MYNKIEYCINTISKLENDVNDLNKELSDIVHEKTEWGIRETKMKKEIQLKNEELQREYVILKELFITEKKG